MTESPITSTDAHRPHAIRFLRLHQAAGWRLKFYGIAASGGEPRAELTRVAESLVPTVLPCPAVHSGGGIPHDVDRYGVGFMIAHDAVDYAFALYGWWAREDELHQRIMSCLPNRLDTMRSHPTRTIGCVQELAVTDFERRSWLRHVLTNPDGPNIEAYLGDHLEGDA